jgi:type IV fimbrial biogenesis protein FimT
MTASKSRAFTLLEMMITVSIIAVLLSLGIPAFQNFALKQRLNAAVTALHNDLLLARNQAIHRNVQVIACPWDAGGGCTGVADWSEGWAVFGDRNEDRNYQEDEILLRRGQGLENVIIHGTASRPTLRFYPNGTAPGSNGSISICGLGGPPQARKLVISNLGRIRRDLAPSLDEAHCPG